MDVLFLILQITNIMSWMLLFFYGMHYYLISMMFLSKRKDREKTMPVPVKLTDRNKPRVTIQLPIYNEIYVVERLLENISRIRWPKNRLEIQVLDDSTDETTAIARRIIARLRKKGLNIVLIHRTDRSGHKAGALKNGLTVTKSEYVAIFDSDFMPEPDFLERTMPYLLADEKLAFVQARWEHLNKDFSAFTYAVSLGIDAHFVVEQGARSMNKLWMNFNGTAGVWRKKAIEDAGNWAGDTLTEDLDLSYRAALKGWKSLFLPDVSCPAEIPAQIMPFKVQQFRWAKGSIQTAKKLVGAVLRSKAPWKIKFEAVTHLTYYSIQFLMMLNLLTLLPVILAYGVKVDMPMLLPFALFTLTLFAPMVLLLIAQRELKHDIGKMMKSMTYVFLMGFGITVYIAIAFIEAIAGRKTAFIRTPKMNLSDKKEKAVELHKRKYRVKLNYVVWLEMLFAIYCFVESWLIARHAWEFNRVEEAVFVYFPFMMGISLTYVVIRTIRDQFIMRKLEQQAA